MKNINQTEVINAIEITCVADFLNILKKEVKTIDNQHERFYRGLEKKEYLETDYPSIYRSPNNDSRYEPYIKYEHEMFYDLVSRFPEQFSSCKNTFEHLVMMQHYEFPTRLLDVTNNPLVALYFACVDKYGHVNEKDDNGKKLDGAITIYDIPNEQIKNYNSDTVTILSNLARIGIEYSAFSNQYNYFVNNTNIEINKTNTFYDYGKVEEIFNNFETQIEIQTKNLENLSIIAKQQIDRLRYFKNNYLNLHKNKRQDLDRDFEFYTKTEYDENGFTSEVFFGSEELKEEYHEYYNQLKSNFNNFIIELKKSKNMFYRKENIKFKQLIQEEKNYFIYENINPEHLEMVFCVKPKLNNPRIISQNGAFLLFGFASLDKTKLEHPEQHLRFKAEKTDSKDKINIIINYNHKQNIVDELKQLGIHRAFLFPEIDKVAQIVTNEYKIKKDDRPQTH